MLFAIGGIVILHLGSRVSSTWLLFGAQQVVSEPPRFVVGLSGDSRASVADLVEIVCRSQISVGSVRGIVCQSQNST